MNHYERQSEKQYRKRIIFDAVIIIFVSLVMAVVLLIAVGVLNAMKELWHDTKTENTLI